MIESMFMPAATDAKTTRSPLSRRWPSSLDQVGQGGMVATELLPRRAMVIGMVHVDRDRPVGVGLLQRDAHQAVATVSSLSSNSLFALR